MRTTIELSDETRSKLLEMAARRGEKGFSRIVEEALEAYFAGEGERRDRIERAVGALGSLGEADADRLEREVRRLRGTWR